jgi:hypothetical protein
VSGNIKRINNILFSFRSILDTIGAITPSLATYGALILSVFYTYTIIGLEVFKKSQPDCQNFKLNNSEFVKYIFNQMKMKYKIFSLYLNLDLIIVKIISKVLKVD